jgi:[NiFe] hydrogenase assembly HybE family chaperone
MSSAANLTDHPRVSALIERFRHIDLGMRDLPIYNNKVAIEPVGFRSFGKAELLGVLLTPWFMNLMILPIEPVAMNMAAIGKTISIELPGGSRTFVVGGDEVIGLYRARSLHSPLLTFTLPGQALAEARRLLTLLMTPPDAEPAATKTALSGLDRRALLFRRRNT